MGISITQVGSRHRARVEGPTVEGKRTFGYHFFGTRREADRFRALVEGGLEVEEAKAMVEGGKAAAAPAKARKVTPTVRQWGETFLAQAEALQALKPQSVRQYRITLETHVYPVLGDVQLHELTTASVKEALAAIANNAVARGYNATGATMLNTRARLCAVLAAAVGTHLSANPAAGIKLGKRKRSAGKIMSDEQRRAVLTAARSHWLGPLVRFAAATGMRRGELAGLTWRYVDTVEGTVQVEVQTVSNIDEGGAHEDTLKTDGSRRKITLPAPIVAELRTMREAAIEDAVLRGRSVAELPVFVNQEGRSWIPDCLTAAVTRFLIQAGAEGYSLHDLRHIHASALLADRQNIKAVSRRLGHSDVRTTLEVYSHLLPQDDAALAKSAANLLEA